MGPNRIPGDYERLLPGLRVNHTAHIDGAVTGLLLVAITDAAAYQRLLATITM